MPELKPCPFCGGNAKMFSAKANAAGTRFVYWVECNGSMCKCSPKTENYYTKEEAAEAWNKRASDWIPCSERMPDMMADRRPESAWSDDLKPSDDVLCYTNFKRQIVAWYSHAYDEWTDVEEDHTYSRDQITHWMPLPPDPPEEVQHVD